MGVLDPDLELSTTRKPDYEYPSRTRGGPNAGRVLLSIFNSVVGDPLREFFAITSSPVRHSALHTAHAAGKTRPATAPWF